MYGSFFIFGLRSLRPFLLHGGNDRKDFIVEQNYFFSKCVIVSLVAGMLSGCAQGEPRAVMLPLEYPDGTPVTTRSGQSLMAGYQTYGSITHSNATALYEQARPATCTTCARVGAVVTEPSTLRQATGLLGTTTSGAGAVMTGVGVMDYGIAAGEGKLRDNYTDNSNVYSNSDSNAYSKSSPRTNVSNNVSNDTSVNQNQSQNQRQSQNQNQSQQNQQAQGSYGGGDGGY
jgi:hypothetical protein